MRKFTYAEQGTLYGEEAVFTKRGVPPFKESDLYPVPIWCKTIKSGYLKVINGEIVEKTLEEKNAFDVAEAAYNQSSKSLTLKTVENNFLLMCDALTGSTSHEKLGFDELHSILEIIPNVDDKNNYSLKLLAIDAEAKREGGLQWWDTCEWNEDIV